MAKKDNKTLGWIDLVIIGLALFLGNVVELRFQISNKVLSFVVFVAASLVFMVIGYFIKYQFFDRDD